MTFQKGVKFRIYPNREQRNLIDRTLGCSRLIYNKGLAMREDAFKSGEKCGYKQTSAMLTALQRDDDIPFIPRCTIGQVAQNHVYTAFWYPLQDVHAVCAV